MKRLMNRFFWNEIINLFFTKPLKLFTVFFIFNVLFYAVVLYKFVSHENRIENYCTGNVEKRNTKAGMINSRLTCRPTKSNN